jgi:hypothetical protein
MNNPDDNFVPSDDFELAEYIQDEAAKVVKKLEWMTKLRSSEMAWERFRSISNVMKSLHSEIEAKHKLEINDEELDDIIKELDEACLEYEDQDCQQYFGYYIRDYANVLVKAIARGFTEEEKYQWEARS